MTAQLATPNMKGFDCNQTLTQQDLRAFKNVGYEFVVRYVPRTLPGGLHDLTAGERALIHQAGLGLMAVQHVESESSWLPNPQKGTAYGQAAVHACTSAEVAPGTTVWLDLEGVSTVTPADIVSQYVNAWAQEVSVGGYQAGLYVGWHAQLAPDQLYRLAVTRYWAAYNLNADQYPTTRGCCMRQGVGSPPIGTSVPIDTDRIMPDLLGCLPTMDMP